MGKLNIAHHKSYHPYRRDNIERVRRDEEAARQAEALAEGRMMLADSEARMDLLRARAGLSSGSKPGKKGTHESDQDTNLIPSNSATGTVVSTLTSASGHINFFEDLERTIIPVHSRSTKKPAPVEDEKGVALAPSAKDLKPWYVDTDRDPSASTSTAREKPWETEEDRRRRDMQRKSAHDPLTAINSQLASRSGPAGPPSSSSHSSRPTASRDRQRALPPPPPVNRGDPKAPPEVSARLARESAERERARALIARKKREMAGSETPSTVHGGDSERGSGYGDVFNRREVEELRRERRKGWERDHERAREGSRRFSGRLQPAAASR
ncbi:hypothetical protein C8Q77DRAFT_1108369 [Trametes polyzona]|nr:hypothetical protein C8Q77DRAFT_1108369 [Trametes polyzona]